MKKGLLILVTLALLGTFAFADMAASVYMTGSLYGTDGLVLNNQAQKDADMLTFSYNGEKSGAYFRLWANVGNNGDIGYHTIVAGDVNGDGITENVLTGSSNNSDVVQMRSAMVWWKPISMLKISIGYVGGYGYTEQLDWWKVPCASSITAFNNWAPRWSSASTGENNGLQIDANPIPDLAITAGLYPGVGTAILKDGYDAGTAWGLQAKYNIAGFGSALAAIRDMGKDNFKIARVGADISAIPNLYAFVTAIMMINNDADPTSTDQAVSGVTIDNYVKYTLDKIVIQARLPITLRLTGNTGDDSYMTWRAMVSYNMDGGITPYLSAECNETPINFSDAGNTIAISVRPGVQISAEKFWMDLGLQIDNPSQAQADAGAELKWSIPFQARVSF